MELILLLMFKMLSIKYLVLIKQFLCDYFLQMLCMQCIEQLFLIFYIQRFEQSAMGNNSECKFN